MLAIPLADRAVLEILDFHHAAGIFGQLDEHRQDLRQWLPFVDRTLQIQDTVGFIRGKKKDFADNGCLSTVLRCDGVVAGIVGFHPINWPNREGSLGYWLAPPFRGRGLMTLAVQRLVQHGFEAWNLHRIEIRVASGNAPSAAIPRRLGFQLEGVSRGSEFLNGRFVDLRVFSRLATDGPVTISRD